MFSEQLEALAAERFDGEWEVVLVDNGSRDQSRAIAASFTDRINLRIVDVSDQPGAAYATNVGVRHSSGKKLIFVADDVIAPGYIGAMASALDHHDFVTSAFDHVALNPQWLQAAHGPVWRDPGDPLFVQSGVLPFAGGSTGISRAVFEQVGGLRDLFRQGFAGGSTAPLLYRHYRHAGMQRRSVVELAKSWLWLARRATTARSRAEVAPLAVELGRQLGRARGSVRYRVFFP